MRNVIVSCPVYGAFEIDRSEVLYEPNGDQTATYWFDCERCWKTHMRHATIGILNMFKGAGVRTKKQFAEAAQRVACEIAPLTEGEIATFAIELDLDDGAIRELL